MHSDVSLSRIKQFPPLIWILLFGAFITRGSYYMVWPFLAVILYQKFAISATEVGLILSAAALVSVFIGFVGGALSDHFGRHQLMFASGLLYVVSFSLLASAETLPGYVLIITLCSIAKAIWEPPTSALIGDLLEDAKTRELAMQARYFVVNVGAALGPMLGVWFGFTGQQSSFYITAGCFALLLVILKWGFAQQGKVAAAQKKGEESSLEQVDSPIQVDSPEQENSQIRQTLSILKQDRVLQCLILANILCMFIYSQMDTSLVQYLTRAEVPDLLQLISAMIVTNSLVIICFQFVLLKMMAALAIVKRIQIGLGILICSQIWLALNPLTFFWGWIGAVVVMSLAEAILFPTMNVHIDRLAPAHLRGAYFGAASFYSMGFAIAPFGGGLILDHFGGPALFFSGALLCLVVIYLYSLLDKLPRPEFDGEAKKTDQAVLG
ncbi:MFS transporter [Thalassomonas sp. RHCl1]|uniref:MDR family MFS transporter n=1 Tax=Thalassomonas sp. RHCl1 TaxID=2995320 RepID=UPI00248C66C7|nr:MFS transporter [Thalassomonas sp. RHCl1]